MKKLFITIIFCLGFVVSSFAAGPKLSCEKFFDDVYVKNINAKVSYMSDHMQKYFKMVIENDKRVEREIIKALEEDCKKTEYRVENYNRGVLVKCLLSFKTKDSIEKSVIYNNDGKGKVELSITETKCK